MNSNQKWYDNIPPQGILCWVGDCETGRKTLRLIRSCSSTKKGVGFKSEFMSGRYATPVTLEEIKQFIKE